MRFDPRKDPGPSAFEQLRDSPGRALVLAVVALVLCGFGVVLVVSGYQRTGVFPWYEAAIPALMLVVAVLNAGRFVYNRRKARNRG